LHPQLLGQPIALTVNYSGPLLAGPFTVTASPRRTNRSTQHWQIEITQANETGVEETMLTATAISATRRATWSSDDAALPKVAPPNSLPAGKPMSAVAWIKLHADSDQVAQCGSRFLRGQAQAQAFRNGFFDQTAQ
jgi:hypothetical protein